MRKNGVVFKLSYFCGKYGNNYSVKIKLNAIDDCWWKLLAKDLSLVWG